MARGRVLEQTIATSDKFCSLWENSTVGELAMVVYLVSYPYADDWGHLPFEATWIKRHCLCECRRPIEDIKRAMLALTESGLWEYVYRAPNGKLYTYIHQFEERNVQAIRHRRRGQCPDESGQTPVRRPDEALAASMADAGRVRAQVQRVTLRNVSERSATSRDVSTGAAR